MKSTFEKLGGTYTLADDGMYYPNLTLAEETESHHGKYGMLRKKFLKEHRRGLYQSLLLTGKLTAHLNEIDDQANERMEILTGQMQDRLHIDEALKASDMFAWIGAMNNIRNSTEEVVLNELIYA